MGGEWETACLNSFKGTDEDQERRWPAGFASIPGGWGSGGGTANAVMAAHTRLFLGRGLHTLIISLGTIVPLTSVSQISEDDLL